MTDLMGFSPDEFLKIYGERYIYQVLQKNFGGDSIFTTHNKPIYVPDSILNAYQKIGMDKILLTPFVQILFVPNEANDEDDDSNVAYYEDECQIKPFVFSTEITHEEIMLIEDKSVHPVLIAGLKPSITCRPILYRFMRMVNSIDGENDDNYNNSATSTLIDTFAAICRNKLYAPLICEDDNSIMLNAILTDSLLNALENSDINGIFNPECFEDEVEFIVKALFGFINENLDDFKNHLLKFAEMIGSISCDMYVHDNDPEEFIYSDGTTSQEWSMKYGAHLAYFPNGINLKE